MDIDLNYVGQIDRETMLKERPGIDTAITQICATLGYQVRRGTDEHALAEHCLGYSNHAGRFDQIQVEINYLMRACALLPAPRIAVPLGDEQECRFPILAIEELIAGKINALMARKHPRDLYDLFRFTDTDVPHNPELLRKISVLYGSTLDRDLREYRWSRLEEIKQSDVERLLYPLLRSDDRPSVAVMLATIRKSLEAILDPKREKDYLEQMAKGLYEPSLLFSQEPEIVQRIGRHPALLWKAGNVFEHLAKTRRPE